MDHPGTQAVTDQTVALTGRDGGECFQGGNWEDGGGGADAEGNFLLGELKFLDFYSHKIVCFIFMGK